MEFLNDSYLSHSGVFSVFFLAVQIALKIHFQERGEASGIRILYICIFYMCWESPDTGCCLLSICAS